MGLNGNRYDICYVDEWPAYTDAVKEAARRIHEMAMKPSTERKETQMEISGANLKAEMTRKDMSLSDLGDELGIGRFAAEKYCKDMTTMPASVIVQAARLFGCSTDWLLDQSSERKQQRW